MGILALCCIHRRLRNHHLVGLVTLWQPVYGLQGLIKVATAGVSVTTAFLLWPLIPKVLSLPSPSALKQANTELEKALIEKDRALRQISALLDSAPDATIFVNRDGTIARANRQTGRLLGYSAAELINEPAGCSCRAFLLRKDSWLDRHRA